MAIKKLLDFTALGALAPGATATRIVNLQGLPRGRRVARLWISGVYTLTRGVGAVAHPPQAFADVVGSINGTIGRHTWGLTSGRDLYVYQEIARGRVLAHNPELAADDTSYRFLFPIPTTYILGGPGEIATRPPSEEFEGGSLNIQFRNPFTVANDVDTLATEVLSLFVEHYARGEEEQSTENPEIKKLAKWGGAWFSRTPPSGTILQVTDIVPTMVLYKDRSWTTMMATAKGQELYANIVPGEMPMLDSDKYNNFEADPQLGYNLGAIATPGNALRMLSQVPISTGAGLTNAENWTKLFDARNDRDADAPLIFTADGAYSFDTAGAIVVGRRAVSGDPEVRK